MFQNYLLPVDIFFSHSRDITRYYAEEPKHLYTGFRPKTIVFDSVQTQNEPVPPNILAQVKESFLRGIPDLGGDLLHTFH